MERFCPTETFSEKKVHLSRWTTFFDGTVLMGNYCSIRKKFGLQYLSVANFWKFLSESEWNGSVQPGWFDQPENFPIYCSICHVKFSTFQTGIFGRMESTHFHPTFCLMNNCLVRSFSHLCRQDLREQGKATNQKLVTS